MNNRYQEAFHHAPLVRVDPVAYRLQQAHAGRTMRRLVLRAAELGCDVIVHDEIHFTGTPEEQLEKSATLEREFWQGKFNDPS